MAAMDSRGIRVIVSTTRSLGEGALNNQFDSPDCYNKDLVISARKIVQHFSQFDNLLAFAVANEVANKDKVSGKHAFGAMPCVKALIRDLRSYMKRCACFTRKIPLMYAATDHSPLTVASTGATVMPRDLIARYLTCGSPDTMIDAYGLNVYTWCSDDSTFTERSTWSLVDAALSSYGQPLLLSEFGCNVGDFGSRYPFDDDGSFSPADGNTQREFKQVRTLLGDPMRDNWSGGFAYEYSMRANDYGLVLLPGYDKDRVSTLRLRSFGELSEEFSASNPKLIGGPAATDAVYTPGTFADWTAATQCAWMPPLVVGGPVKKAQQECPSDIELNNLWKAADLTGTENWSNALPTVPEQDIYVSCPENKVLSEDLKREQQCIFGGASVADCPCDSILADDRCKVASLPADYTLVENFFVQQCQKM